MASTPVTAQSTDGPSPPAPSNDSSPTPPSPASDSSPTSATPASDSSPTSATPASDSSLPPSQSPPSSPSPPPPQSPPPSPPSSPSPPPPQQSSPPPPSSSPPPAPPDSPPPTSSPSLPNASPPPPPTSTKNNSPPPSTKSSSPRPPSLPSTKSSSPPPPSPAEALSLPSPPPPPHSRSPSHSSRASHSKLTPSSSGSDSDATAVIYIGISAGVFALIVVALILVCCFKKKKRRSDPMHYYADTGRPPKGGDHFHGESWHNRVQLGLPPPPGGAGGAPGGVRWAMPPPPPPMMNSSDMSSNFSSPKGHSLSPSSPNIALGFTKSTFTYEELALATNGFSPANLLGQGGFGYVHKGVLPNGKEIAVKQLKSGSGQGEREFQAEVEIISRVHHRHLVSLVGYCIASNQRMLVYEFVSNNTLEYHLHGMGRPTMDWPTRLKIALGSAKGLAYLHEDCHPRIIHRDIKAANILLDYKFEAQVADFGLAKLSSDNYTHVSTRVMGTFGYLAPEYASSGKLTEKSDVFSFGVMLLELLTGRRPVDPTFMEDSLVEWARPLLVKALEEGDFGEVADPRLENNYNVNEMSRLVACAAASVRHSARRRPRMTQIVRALEGDMSLDALNEGVKPGQSGVFGSGSDYGPEMYNADMSRMRKMALGTQEFGTDEFGSGPTSEYGLNPSTSTSEGNSREMDSGHYLQKINQPVSSELHPGIVRP